MTRLLSALLLLLAGCCGTCPPREARVVLQDPPGFRGWCCAFGYGMTGVLPVVYLDNTVDGPTFVEHAYGGSLGEDNGILYTCRGGFLDTTHVRDFVDWTAFLYEQLRSHYWTGRPIELPPQAARAITLRTTPRGRPPSDELLLGIASRVAWEFSVWHEVVTWYGWKSTYVFPEQLSAFSPEDLVSNLLGVRLGADVIRRLKREPKLGYDQAVSRELRRLLRSLHPVSREQTKRALDAVEGEDGWWDRSKGLPRNDAVPRRYLSLGPVLTPWPVPRPARFCPQPDAHPGHRPLQLQVPTRAPAGDLLASYYELRIAVDRDDVPKLPLPPGKTVIGSAWLPALVAHVRREVKQAFGPLGDRPERPTVYRLSGGRRLVVYRSDRGHWQVQVQVGDHVRHSRAFRSRADLWGYLAKIKKRKQKSSG